MSKVMSYESSDGIVHAESYWIPVQVNLCKLSKSGVVDFYGYANAAARIAEKAPIAGHRYTISTADYNSYFSPAALQPLGVDPYAAAYSLADDCLEIPGPVLEDGTETKKSFFDGATDA